MERVEREYLHGWNVVNVGGMYPGGKAAWGPYSDGMYQTEAEAEAVSAKRPGTRVEPGTVVVCRRVAR